MIKDIIAQNENAAPNSKEIEILKTHFPSYFNSEGEFEFERFKEHIKDEVSFTHEGYELKFLGKNYARLLASTDTETVITPDEKHNSLPENKDSGNVYISADNLDALKHLKKSYEGAIKCIYIDPPYNTGTDGFVYKDNFGFTAEELSNKLSIDEEQAQRILNFTKKGSASHSAWLMFMYPRLALAHDLLTKDGVIFISIDDNEQANLKLICDEIFGEQNFVASIIVQSNKRGQTYKQLSKTHEYLLVYTKESYTILNELTKNTSTFNKQDNLGEFEERELRNRNPKFGKFNRENLFYSIFVNPYIVDDCGYCPISLTKSKDFSIEVLPYNSEGVESCWRWGQNKFNRYNNSECSMESDVVARKKSTGEYGIYEKYRKGTFKAKTIWYEDDIVGDLVEEDDDIWEDKGVITEQGSKELKKYDMAQAFDFPKPTYLIKKIMTIGGCDDSIFLDFFSGSGTSVEALMSLNCEDNGTRKIIVVQIPDNLDKKYENSKKTDKAKIKNAIEFLDTINQPHTLDQVGIERIKRAADKLREEYPDTAADLGFKHYTLKEVSIDTLDKLDEFNADSLLENNLLDEFGVPTVLTTWLIRDGYGFTAPVQAVNFDGYTAYYCKDHLYLLNEGISEQSITAIAEKLGTDKEFTPKNIVLFGYSFKYTQMESLKTNLKLVNDKLKFDVRY